MKWTFLLFWLCVIGNNLRFCKNRSLACSKNRWSCGWREIVANSCQAIFVSVPLHQEVSPLRLVGSLAWLGRMAGLVDNQWTLEWTEFQQHLLPACLVCFADISSPLLFSLFKCFRGRKISVYELATSHSLSFRSWRGIFLHLFALLLDGVIGMLVL